MPVNLYQKPVFRFAPSPNGLLHLGHALSAILNHDMAQAAGGRLLLRIEDIDLARCSRAYEEAIGDDLAWLGLTWEQPVRRQSEHFEAYAEALGRLDAMGLIYPAFLTRGEVKAMVTAHVKAGNAWPRDPDGSPLYPDICRRRSAGERQALMRQEGRRYAWRLDMAEALARTDMPLDWQDSGDGERATVAADPAAWGDVILSRSDAPSSYHLSVVVDDAAQGVTHVVRGLDLFHATSVHRLLQVLLGLPQPLYHHHRLLLDPEGRKLSKSSGATGLAQLRQQGLSAADIRRLVGLG
ncbi:tRNA glutamyl-Q(34) synthetase GluQRS [Neorhizobium sp. NPDC001467]|uniref:tRNA glutamyl-Q(34) synthetase GluQRS n=1 Tax=Neorhizobium sp. NPDC001467 TaxID=3390595 RepID=UPI003D01C993